MKASKELISDLARKSLKGDSVSFRFLEKILRELGHPIEKTGPLDVIEQLTHMVINNPKPVMRLQALTWQTGQGKLHSADGPAEIWFQDRYLGYYSNGRRHRANGPAVIDVANGTIMFFDKGGPRTYSRGPFRVERMDGSVAITYITDDPENYEDDLSMANRAPALAQERQKGSLLQRDMTESVESSGPGSHIIVTRDYVDIEGLGKSMTSDEDLKNLDAWDTKLANHLAEANRYIEQFLDNFE